MIGMFDSGLGGLSVWRQLRHALPQQDVVYLADQGYCPYGERSQAEIIARAEAITAWLLQQGAQLLLIACNTATSAAARHLRERYPQLPIVGMEPAIKPAVLASQSGRVGVLATHATLQGDKFRQLVAQFAGDTLVVPQAGKGFVELVESGELDSERSRAVVSRALAPLLEHSVDHVVLGCTHYPFLAPLMRQLLPAHIDLIDPTDAVIRQTLRLMQQHGIATEDGDSARYRFVSTGQPPSMAHFLQHTLGTNAGVEYIDLPG